MFDAYLLLQDKGSNFFVFLFIERLRFLDIYECNRCFVNKFVICA